MTDWLVGRVWKHKSIIRKRVSCDPGEREEKKKLRVPPKKLPWSLSFDLHRKQVALSFTQLLRSAKTVPARGFVFHFVQTIFFMSRKKLRRERNAPTSPHIKCQSQAKVKFHETLLGKLENMERDGF